MPFKVNAIIAEKIMGLQVREKQITLKDGRVVTVWDYYDEHPNIAAIGHKERRRAQFLQAMTGDEETDKRVSLQKGPRWKPVKDYVSAIELAWEVEEEMYRRGWQLTLRRFIPNWNAWFQSRDDADGGAATCERASEAICCGALDTLRIAYEQSVRGER